MNHHPQISNYPPPARQHHPNDQAGGSPTTEYDSASSPLPRYTSPLNPNPNNSNTNNRNRQQQQQQQHPEQQYQQRAYNSMNQQQHQHHHNQYQPHPLSNPTYTDSSPTLSTEPQTLSGSTPQTPSAQSLEKSASPIDPHHHQNNLYQQAPTSASPELNLSSRPSSFISRREIVHHSPLAKVHRAWTGAAIGDSGIDERHVKKKRLAYLDALKFFAAIIVMNGTLFDAVLTENDYKPLQRGSPLYIFRSTNLGISMMLILSGRCLIAPLWDAPSPHAKLLMKNQDPNKPLISWARLTRAMLIRPFRFLLPVIAVAALQWGLASGGDNRATKNCNNAGMTEPYWANVDRFAGFMTLFFDLFTYFEVDTIAGKAFGGNLWTVPWLFQSSYAVYVTHFMLGNLPSNRYWVYGILMAFSWTSLNYFALPITGLLIADMAAHGQIAKLRKMSMIGRIGLRIGLLGLALATQWVPIVRDNLNTGMAKINVQSHGELTFADWIFATVILFIVETSEIAQLILSNIVFRILGKLSAGIYLLSPAIVFTLVPTMALKLHDAQTYQASGVLGISWCLLMGASFGSAILFYLFIECPSKLLGEIVVNNIEKMGVDPELAKRDAEDLKALMSGGSK
ncbi:hypothetical protein PSTG_15018 [Puccinia striiformis f. sp. tritici PST-78]|uniref:Acyltransferase 3 domain-containing protein n=2 Tax=Puccinia striiformis f. sp. tritici TaxID=168172 RepID=A0A0L0UXB4_9BASI|nr:hypothetical protein PSTG_15018 [Puccinia striiformis f. sp. tritici PST-78]